jgi:glycopeptide antibiotics resistance protein
MTTRARRIAWLIFLGYGVAVLFIALWPTPVNQPFDTQLQRFLDWVHREGVPQQVNYTFVEASANMLLFVPFGALVALLSAERLWWVCVVFGLTLSLSIELGQYLFLPQRYATASDILANTSGALLGGGIVAVVRWWEARRSTT